MRTLLFSTILVIALCIGFNHLSFASCSEGPANTFTCDTSPPNPDPDGVKEGSNPNNLTVNMLPGSAIDTLTANDGIGGDGIETDTGNDVITITDADIKGQEDGIDPGPGDDVMNISGSTILGRSCVIDATGGSKTVTVVNSQLIAGTAIADAINTSGGESIIDITGSVITGGTSNQAIDASSSDDQVTITQSTLTGISNRVVDLSSGDDTLTLNTGANIEGNIRCSAGFDTINFAMAVPSNQIAAVTAEIESKDPAGDSIVINGLTYTWDDCEELVPQLTGGFETNVPTLSEWGLIAMAGILGIAGFMVIRRKADC